MRSYNLQAIYAIAWIGAERIANPLPVGEARGDEESVGLAAVASGDLVLPAVHDGKLAAGSKADDEKKWPVVVEYTGNYFPKSGSTGKAEDAGSTATWASSSFASLGLTPGTYVATVPSDTISIAIVPEPTAAWLLCFSLLLGAINRRKR